MFFLKELPSQRMIDGYADTYGADTAHVARNLANLRQASLMIRRLDGYFAGHRMSQLRFLFLIVIDREPDRDTLTIGEITARLDVAGPVVTRTLRMLLDAGLIVVTRDTGDARAKYVGLTMAGRSTLDALLPGYFAVISQAME